MEKFESFSSRFSRASDILTQKVLKGFYIMIQEPVGTFIDLANQAEKSGFIEEADSLLIIRDLRNHIAHEYEDEQLNKLYGELIEACPELLKICERVKSLLQKYTY